MTTNMTILSAANYNVSKPESTLQLVISGTRVTAGSTHEITIPSSIVKLNRAVFSLTELPMESTEFTWHKANGELIGSFSTQLTEVFSVLGVDDTKELVGNDVTILSWPAFTLASMACMPASVIPYTIMLIDFYEDPGVITAETAARLTAHGSTSSTGIRTQVS